RRRPRQRDLVVSRGRRQRLRRGGCGRGRDRGRGGFVRAGRLADRVRGLHHVVVGGAVHGGRVRVARRQAGAGGERASELARGGRAIDGGGGGGRAAVRGRRRPRQRDLVVSRGRRQ